MPNHTITRSLLLLTNLLLHEKNEHFRGFFTQFWDVFNLYVNRRFILDEMNNLLIGETYVNENTLMIIILRNETGILFIFRYAISLAPK